MKQQGGRPELPGGILSRSFVRVLEMHVDGLDIYKKKITIG